MNAIFITSFFDLKNIEESERRSFDFYLEKGRTVLSSCKHLIIFTESNLKDQIFNVRKEYFPDEKYHINVTDESSCQIIETTFNELPNLEYRETITKIRENIINLNKVKDTPNFLFVQWAKFHFIRETYKLFGNSFSHYVWIDFGISHVAEHPDILKSLIHHPSKIKLLSLRPTYMWEVIHPDFLKYFNGRTGGGLWSTPQQLVITFCDLFDNKKVELLNNGYAPLEDDIVTVLRIFHKDLFELYYGDYCDIIRNFNKEIRCQNFVLFQSCMRMAFSLDDVETIADMGYDLYRTDKSGVNRLPDDVRRYIYRTTIRSLRKLDRKELADEIETFSLG